MAKSQADLLMGDAPAEPVEDIQEMVGAVWSDTVNIAPEKLQIPFLTLLQSNSKVVADEIGKMGDWYIEGYPPMKTVTIVPMKFAESRKYTIMRDNELVTACYTPPGGIKGIAKEPEGPGMLCAECPLLKWTQGTTPGPDGKVKNLPPLCKESYDFVAFCMEVKMPVRVSFRSTGAKVGRMLATAGAMSGLGNFVARLGSKKESGKMVYAAPTLTILDGEEAQEALELGQMMAQLSASS